MKQKNTQENNNSVKHEFRTLTPDEVYTNRSTAYKFIDFNISNKKTKR